MLLIVAGCGGLVAAGSSGRRAEAAPLADVGGGPLISASAASSPWSAATVPASAPATMAASLPGSDAAVSARDGTAELQVPDDASTELRRLVRHAVAGQASAQHDLGTFFALGIEAPRNFELAAYWYRRAADQGVANASYNLGVLLERGLGVPHNSEEAVARFRDAAAAGHAGALNALGFACLNGSGIERDPEEALAWFRRVSTAGSPRGAYNVARLYESGELGVPDPWTAAGWYRVAADAGDERAREALARLQALAGAGAPAAMRVGFVRLAPESSLLALGQAGMSDDDSDRILDDLAAQLAAPATKSLAGAAMASGSDMPGAQPAAQLERPITTAEIAEVQRLLAEMNLDVGRIDGRLGWRTRSAIAAFQRSHDLPVTRWPSAALLGALRTAMLVAERE